MLTQTKNQNMKTKLIKNYMKLYATKRQFAGYAVGNSNSKVGILLRIV
jgi:hypothetical protein